MMRDVKTENVRTDQNFIDLFRQYVEEKFTDYRHQMNSVQRSRRYSTEEQRENEFRDRRNTFNQEVQEKIDSLIASGKPWLHNDLQKIKIEYLSKFDFMEQA